MPRRFNGWALDRANPTAGPNARIALAFMRCVRRLPGAVSSHNYDDLGVVIAPALEGFRTPLRAALKAHTSSAAAKSAGAEDIEVGGARMLLDRGVQIVIGEALARPLPRFKVLFDAVEEKLAKFTAEHPHPSEQNIETLSRLLGLPAAENAYLKLAAAFCYGTIERSNFAFVNTYHRATKAVAAMCDVDGPKVARMFDANGPLARSGLLAGLSSKRSCGDLDDLLCLSPLGERLLSTPFANAAEMSAAVLTPLHERAEPLRLEWPHLDKPQALLRAALGEALQRGTPGFNVLLHGAPGTGKTEFARSLLSEIGAAAFAIDHTDKDGEEASRDDRLASLRLSQTFAGERQRSVLVLDEAEDIFQDDYQHPLSRLFERPSTSKAWMNNLLETNPHPVIWISNQVSHLDPAYLRRFAFCLEFPKTPYALRRRIADEQLSLVGCSAETVDAVAASDYMTPALMASAVQFASLSTGSGLGPDLAVRTLIDEHVKASGLASPPLSPKRATRFDMRYLNVDGNATPDRVLSALQADNATTMVFCGPPGTGKTQFAAEIAKQLGRHLVVRTASDINTKWYGESERNVARMFRECDPRSELLFLDEAEVLLGSRAESSHRADRAVTAEFLRWLEVFEGIFICATNHVADFDAALMRRFTFRLAFKPLDVRQRETLYAELALGLAPFEGDDSPILDSATANRLGRLQLLTPGDFANVAKRVRQLGLTASAWLEELEQEHAAKEVSRSARIGFV